MLASVANNQNEKEARGRIMSQYPSTLKGQLQGLKHFTQKYIPEVKEGKGFDHIGRDSKSLENISLFIYPSSVTFRNKQVVNK